MLTTAIFMFRIHLANPEIIEVQDSVPSSNHFGPAQKMAFITALAHGDTSDLDRRPCVDCGRVTGRSCDSYDCFAAARIPTERWRDWQRTPLCGPCEHKFEVCRFCRGVPSCRPFARDGTIRTGYKGLDEALAETLDAGASQGSESRSSREARSCRPFMDEKVYDTGAQTSLASCSMHRVTEAMTQTEKKYFQRCESCDAVFELAGEESYAGHCRYCDRQICHMCIAYLWHPGNVEADRLKVTKRATQPDDATRLHKVCNDCE